MSIRLGRIFGIPLDMDISWLIIMGLFTYVISVGYFGVYYPGFGPAAQWSLAVATSLLFFATLIGHELAHCYFARKSGIAIAGITLFIFGGVARMKSEPSRPVEEMKMAAAGPAFSILIGLAAWWVAMLSPAGGAVRGVLAYVAIANIFVAIFNLLPGFPMDGGRVLRAFLWFWTRNLTSATRTASLAGQTMAWAMIGFGLLSVVTWGHLGGLWFVFIGWFLNGAAQSAYQQILARRALEGLGVGELVALDVPPLDPDMTIDDLVNDYFLKERRDFYLVSSRNGANLMITPDDVRSVPRQAWPSRTVGETARPIPEHLSLDAGEDAWAAVQRLSDAGPKGRLVVIDEGHAKGVVTPENLGRLIKARMQLHT